MIRLRTVVVLALLGSFAVAARADEQSDQEARRLYADGRAAFEAHEYQRAYDAFKRAYLIAQRPELLFNMSSALKELGRPHEAADELRAYLRVVADNPDRAAIEQRIRTLEESQRLLDQENAGKPSALAPTPAPIAQAVAPTPVEKSKPAYKKWWVWTLVGVGLVGIGLGVGLGVGLSGPSFKTNLPPVGPGL
jgi:tetratricopeptide (TPR) repeat protein